MLRSRRHVDSTMEEKLLEKFRNVCQDILQPHHDDDFLIRWLRARDYDIAKAEKMIRESFKFRRKIGADTILTSAYELPEVYVKHPVTICLGFDRENGLTRYAMAGICDYKGYVYSLRFVDLIKLVVYFLESDLKMIHEAKKKIGKVEEKTSFILDFDGFNLAQFYDKTVISAGRLLITMYQDNYPELLKAAYLINVPSYFSWIFNLFKPFINSVTLSKIKIYGKGDWQDEIFRVIDKEQIPAFMGGELTDPDGDPKCRTMINWDSKIPTSYYLKQNRHKEEDDDPSMKFVTVQQRSSLDAPVTIQNAGSILKWVFRTKDNNIKFGLFYKHENKIEELVTVESVDCHVIPEENSYICERIGTYVLHFDNSHSWLTAKQLWYKFEVQSPEEEKNE